MNKHSTFVTFYAIGSISLKMAIYDLWFRNQLLDNDESEQPVLPKRFLKISLFRAVLMNNIKVKSCDTLQQNREDNSMKTNEQPNV